MLHNVLPLPLSDVRDKEKQLLDTWLCESILFQGMSTELWAGSEHYEYLLYELFLGNRSSGCPRVKAVHSFLGFVLEALQREAESRLSLADLELAWGFGSSSVLEPHPTSFVCSPWTHLTAALLLWGIYAEFVCFLNQPRGGMGYILPVHFSVPPASHPFLCMSEAEHFSSKQQQL